MDKDFDLQSYFMERAPKSGQEAENWSRTVDVLLGNGVKTMKSLSEKKDDLWLFRMFMDENNVLDEKGCALARKVRDEYLKTTRKVGLIAAREVFVETYFRENAPPETGQKETSRIINALNRERIETMSALCALSPEEVASVRNIGGKSLILVLRMREKYLTQQKTVQHSDTIYYREERA